MQLGVASADHTHHSSINDKNSLWTFLRLINLTPSEGLDLYSAGLACR